MAGALVGDRIDDLGLEVVLGTLERGGQGRPDVDQAEHVVDPGAVAAEQVVDPRDVQSGPPGQRDPLVGPRLVAVRTHQQHPVGDGLTDVRPERRLERVPRGVDGVGGHHPVGRQLAAGDHHEAGHGRDDGVLAGDLGGRLGLPGEQRPQAGVDALDVLVVQRLAQDRVDVAEDVVDVGAAGRGVGLVEVPRGVGGADDPVPAPRDDEQHRRLGTHDEPGVGPDPVPGHHEVDALGRLDVQGAAAADHLLDLVGPDAGRVDDHVGADLEVGAVLQVAGADTHDPLPLAEEPGHLDPGRDLGSV